ncbi:hypothetical protein PI124_g20301 [Phytophthora idaei]|nr:hypothetical protein PI124_g20301 [Phytophthora idaei]
MFTTFVILKHYDTWDKHAIGFGLKTNILEKMIFKLLKIVKPIFFKEFVKPIGMKNQREKGDTFRNYPYALYATDVKFQPANHPSGRFTEQKAYFSGKHKLYGYKLDCPVACRGQAVDLSLHEPGSTSDVTMFVNRRDTHLAFLAKDHDELHNDDNGEGSPEHPVSCAVLVDKGYQGAAGVTRTIQPTRKPRGGELTHAEVARNKLVSADRVIVENYFGRVCSLWKVMYVPFKWNEVRLDRLARICFALTNYHVGFMPLCREDSVTYRSVLARYQSMAEETRAKRTRSLKAYRTRRDERLAAATPPLFATYADSVYPMSRYASPTLVVT